MKLLTAEKKRSLRVADRTKFTVQLSLVLTERGLVFSIALVKFTDFTTNVNLKT